VNVIFCNQNAKIISICVVHISLCNLCNKVALAHVFCMRDSILYCIIKLCIEFNASIEFSGAEMVHCAAAVARFNQITTMHSALIG
jgi:hypothetical protein